MIKRFLHLAITTDNLDNAIPIYEALGMQEVERFECPEPKASVVVMEDRQGTGIELWQFIDTTHPNIKFLDGHTAYESDSLEADAARLQRQGFTETIPPNEDDTLRFVHLQAPNGLQIELCEYKSRPEK